MIVRELPPRWSAETVARRLAARPGLAWLDSAGAGHAEGRFSFVTCDPVERVRTQRSDPAPFSWLDRLTHDAADARDTYDTYEPPHGHGISPEIVPRYVGYFAYDAHFCTHPPRMPRPDARVACFARYEACFAFDHETGRAFVVGDDGPACARLCERLSGSAPEVEARAGDVSCSDPAAHTQAIARALAHIARGDVYQVNLARSFRAAFRGDPLALALAMRTESPVPLGLYFHDGERALIGRSMERFLRWQRATRALLTRPIKGTLARAGQDADEAARLANDPKERAEHAMIIDLMRNDLSRVAELGSVRVSEVMAVERYAKLSHLVSTVSCTTRLGLELRAILEATFPAGSVTGAPKLRAIELIEALEATPRGIYTGAYGYIDRAGGLSLAVAIRTAVVTAEEACYFAGGGIVEASDPARELAETTLKARVFCDALLKLRPL